MSSGLLAASSRMVTVSESDDTVTGEIVSVDPATVELAVPSMADRHPAAVYLSRLAPGSRPAMRSALDILADLASPGATAETLAWHKLGYQHAQALRSLLADRYAMRTANRMLSALRGVVQEAWRLGLMSAEDSARIRDVANIDGTPDPSGRALGAAEVGKLLAACDSTTPRGARDAALVALLFGGGLRRAEVVGIDLADVDGNRVKVIGKGRKARTVAVPQVAVSAVATWLAVRGTAPGPLFTSVGKSGVASMARLAASSVYDLLHEIGERAGVASFTPHDARRTRLTDLIDAGVDLAQVQRFAGHSNVATTLIYDRRADETRHAATAAVEIGDEET